MARGYVDEKVVGTQIAPRLSQSLCSDAVFFEEEKSWSFFGLFEAFLKQGPFNQAFMKHLYSFFIVEAFLVSFLASEQVQPCGVPHKPANRAKARRGKERGWSSLRIMCGKLRSVAGELSDYASGDFLNWF